MKIRFIEEGKQDNILMETENAELLNGMGLPYMQLYITKENKVLICEYNYSVKKLPENKINIYVTITDIDELPSKKPETKKNRILKADLFDAY